MGAAVIAFLLKNWKVVLYVAAGVAILLFIRWYGVSQWNQGVDFGDKRTQLKLEAQYKQAWDVEKQLIKADQEKIAAERVAQAKEATRLATQMVEVGRLREESKQTLAKAVAVAQVRKEDIDAIVKAVPVNELDERIRMAARANKAAVTDPVIK